MKKHNCWRLLAVPFISLFVFAQSPCHAEMQDQKKADVPALFRWPGCQQIEYQDVKKKLISQAQFESMVAAGELYVFSFKNKGDRCPSTLRIIAKDQVRIAKLELKPGMAFPRFKLADASGGKVDNASLAGRYALLNFYFADCEPCNKEVPELNALAKQHPDVKLLAITVDDLEQTKEFVARTKLQWPIAIDGKDLVNEIGMFSFPSFVLLDPKGKVLSIGTSVEVRGGLKDLDEWLAHSTSPSQPQQH
jgi:peroxiredoxin